MKTKDTQDFVRIQVKIPMQSWKAFQAAYPELHTLYLERAFNFAIKSRSNFDAIFWLGVDKNKELPE